MNSNQILIKVLKNTWILFFIPLIYSCHKSTDFSTTPAIIYKNFLQHKTSKGKDSTGVLTISFTDGDGDIGLGEGDTLYPYNRGNEFYYNFIIKYFEKQKGVFKEDTLFFKSNARIPNLTPQGKNTALKGEISYELFDINYTSTSTHDTIRYEAYIVDRALNKSNVITTDEIIISK